jgi:hypothetical protein
MANGAQKTRPCAGCALHASRKLYANDDGGGRLR